MFTLITNETRVITAKNVYIRWCLFLSSLKQILWGSFDLNQTKHVKDDGGKQGGSESIYTALGPYEESKVFFQISVMVLKQNFDFWELCGNAA